MALGFRSVAVVAAVLIAAGPALAVPQPTKPVASSFFTGRWYEIARSPNANQRDCQAPTYDFGAPDGGKPTFALTCHKGAPRGKAETLAVHINLPATGPNNRFRVTALAGLVGVNYLVLDRADDQSWWIFATADGKNVWLLARKPSLPQAEQSDAVGRIKAFGYNAGALEYPKH